MEQPAFEVMINGEWYKIYRYGLVEGEGIIGTVINRIPLLLAEAEKLALTKYKGD